MLVRISRGTTLRIGFSGHRPDKLGGYSWEHPINKLIMNAMYNNMIELISNYPRVKVVKMIFGGALGFDQMMFDIMKKVEQYFISMDRRIEFSFEIAIPFEDQYKAWKSKKDIERYFSQLKQANLKTYVDTIPLYDRSRREHGRYDSKKLQWRNEYIVDNSNVLIMLWDGSTGGTCNCIKYAKKKSTKYTEIMIYDPKKIISDYKNKHDKKCKSFFK